MLTGNKDVDRKILNKLDDKDLVNVCQTNKKAESLCNDQVFWMNRVFNRFPEVKGDILRKFKGTRSWSEYYIQDLRKINKTNAEEYLESGSKEGRITQVAIALELGAKGNNVALKLASRNGHLEVVKYIIEQGADIHIDDDEALKLASRGHLDVVKYLLEQGADIHIDDDFPLIEASAYGYLEVVKYLVSQGANIHAQDDDAMIIAIIRGHLEIVKYLVSQGANIHAQNDAAMGWAKHNGHSDIIDYLESL